MISECKLNEDDDEIREANAALLHVIEQNGGMICRQKIEVDKTDRTNFILNPSSIQVTHLNEGLSEEKLRNCILASHHFLQVVWNRRKRLKRNAKRETNRSENQVQVGDGRRPTKGNIGFYFKKVNTNDEKNQNESNSVMQFSLSDKKSKYHDETNAKESESMILS